MKNLVQACIVPAFLFVSLQVAKGTLNIPSDGSDGALVITSNTVIDLSQAIIGQWDTNNSANAGKGVYDPEKWAVVFKYSSVTIGSNATVTFKNHASRAPVVWLVQGDVMVNGIINLNGKDGLLAPALPEPGPGGFRGGISAFADGIKSSAGFGPGGGYTDHNTIGAGGSYGSLGFYGSTSYGNPSLLPLLGGSGGGGAHPYTTPGGPGAGGGALLLATPGVISVKGLISANGGRGFSPAGDRSNGGGSGGGVRLIAQQISGSGTVNAIGGQGPQSGGLGRIRIERITNNSNFQITPDPSVVTLEDGATPQIWLPTNGPAVKIVSIGGTNAPFDARAEFGAMGADVSLPQVNTTAVVIETTNVEQASTVSVRVTPRSNGNFTSTTAVVDQVVSQDPLVIRWRANVPVNNGYSAMQVKVVRP